MIAFVMMGLVAVLGFLCLSGGIADCARRAQPASKK
jgi:hypothetical protein